jgi:hypothetical protein
VNETRSIEAEIENLTPHSVTVISDDGATTMWLPCHEPARVGEKRIPLGVVAEDGAELRVNRKSWDRDNATNIPPKKPGKLYIVSTVIAEAFPERDDFLVPDEIERDSSGEIVGCHALAQMWPASNQVAREYLDRARDYVTRPPEKTQSDVQVVADPVTLDAITPVKDE